MIRRGEVWWADLPDPDGSGPGFRRPVVIIQEDAFNQSNIGTIIVAPCTSRLGLAQLPGNLLVQPRDTGLPKPSVVNVTQLTAVDRRRLTARCARLPDSLIRALDEGLRLVLSL